MSNILAQTEKAAGVSGILRQEEVKQIMPRPGEREIASFFAKMPEVIPIYEKIEGKILDECEDVMIEIKKTQVTFKSKRGFAYVWLPVRKMKNRPESYLVLSFGLDKRIESPRIVESIEPYRNRWMHHLIMEKPEEIDDELMGWIHEAYVFAKSH